MALFTVTELLNKRHTLKFVAWMDFMNVGAHISMSARELKEWMNLIYCKHGEIFVTSK